MQDRNRDSLPSPQSIPVKRRADAATPSDAFLELQRAAGNQATVRFVDQAFVQRTPGEGKAAAAPSAAPEQGRVQAADYLETFAPNTLGHVMASPVRAFADMFTVLRLPPNLGSANIASHYREVTPLLSQPATPQLLRTVAENETTFWRAQPLGSLAWFMGGIVPATVRYSILREAAERARVPGFEAERRAEGSHFE
jgi:hypothetical protein